MAYKTKKGMNKISFRIPRLGSGKYEAGVYCGNERYIQKYITF
jgi:hypothetical protein